MAPYIVKEPAHALPIQAHAFPVGQLTLVARNGKLSAILWEKERANRVRLGELHLADDSPVLLKPSASYGNTLPAPAISSIWRWTSTAPISKNKSGRHC